MPRLTASSLKWIALVCMLLDHVGCLMMMLYRHPIAAEHLEIWKQVAFLFRSLGRTAFPIFAVMLVEGFRHTHSHSKYAKRLLLFALASELPHRLFFHNPAYTSTYQWNIGFMLLLLFLLLTCYQKIKTWQQMGVITRNLLHVVLCLSFCLMARSLPLGYSYPAVLICTFYYWMPRRILSPVLSYLAIGARSKYFIGYVLPFVLLSLYNGKPGNQRMKYFFYFFYPLHLLALWGILMFLTK